MGTKQNIMNKIRKALISVSNKKDLKPVINALTKFKIEIISSEGHIKKLKNLDLNALKFQSLQIHPRF